MGGVVRMRWRTDRKGAAAMMVVSGTPAACSTGGLLEFEKDFLEEFFLVIADFLDWGEDTPAYRSYPGAG